MVMRMTSTVEVIIQEVSPLSGTGAWAAVAVAIGAIVSACAGTVYRSARPRSERPSAVAQRRALNPRKISLTVMPMPATPSICVLTNPKSVFPRNDAARMLAIPAQL